MAIIESGRVIEGSGTGTPLRFTGAGAPAANFLAGTVVVGSMLINTQTGVLYICTATNGSTTATWTAVGAQV
jgi:hypothetical protein